MPDKQPWWTPARVPFLLLTPACMALGVAVCWWLSRAHASSLAWPDAILAVLGGLMAHVSVNALNEYVDFKSGLDMHTQRTPFSGGSGALPARPELAGSALVMGLVALAWAMCTGLYFLWRDLAVLPALMPLGLIGLALVVAYTPWVTRHPWLCLIAPGLGFGPLMLLGTSAVLLGRWAPEMVVMALLPFGLVNNLLLLNQFPDVDADRRVGRVTLPMLLGKARCWPVLLAQYGLAYGALVCAVLWMGVPRGALLGLLTLPVALNVVRGASRHADNTPALLPFMGMNVAVNLLTPVLTAVGLVVGA
ncbi:MAG: prenyltransferase [Aquabacterium sp.]|uniref:prenyltransferase n=1 Tax=Aquabacterium sp. TaxID=1872578 RepID=UPI0011FB0C7B|nr:prenyltransferase [Aquabacterium sp.]TAK88770.1 MAG: prenyltransferase [Aquabacterium sp.]